MLDSLNIHNGRYLVTGGAGFIGSHLVETLVAKGAEVVVLDDFSTGKRENLEPFMDRIRLVEGSVVDPEVCGDAMRDVDFVLHQAALGSVPRSVADPLTTHEVNLNGTLNVLIAARDAGVKRVVYAGSSSAYGDTEELPKDEDMIPRPLSPYAVSKLGGEQYCKAFHASYGLPSIALRYFNVFGPRQDPTSRYAAVIPLFFTAALEKRSPTIYGDGQQTRDFTYVDNVVQANLLACQAPEAAFGNVFNVGCGERISIRFLWDEIASITGAETAPVFEDARRGDVRDSLASVHRAASTFGFRTRVDVRQGLRKALDWFQGVAAASRNNDALVPKYAVDYD